MAEFDPQTDPGIAIFYEGKIGDDRGFRFQTVVSRDCSSKDLGGLVDKLRNEADRQQAIYSIDVLAANIDKEMKLLVEVQQQIKDIAEKNVINWRNSGKQGPPTLSTAEKDNLARLESSLTAKQNEIKRWQTAIEIAKRKTEYATE